MLLSGAPLPIVLEYHSSVGRGGSPDSELHFQVLHKTHTSSQKSNPQEPSQGGVAGRSMNSSAFLLKDFSKPSLIKSPEENLLWCWKSAFNYVEWKHMMGWGERFPNLLWFRLRDSHEPSGRKQHGK